MTRKIRTLPLSYEWETQESCWKNLVNNAFESDDGFENYINKELAKYNGKIIGWSNSSKKRKYDYILFDNHDCMVQFKLSWS